MFISIYYAYVLYQSIYWSLGDVFFHVELSPEFSEFPNHENIEETSCF